MNKHDDFEDIFSGKSDEYEDISSGRENWDRMGNDVYSNERPVNRGNRASSGEYEDVYSEYKSRPGKKERYNPSGSGRRGGKGKKGKKIVAIVLVVAILISAVFGYLGYNLLDKINYVPSEHSNLYLDQDKLISDRKVTNILFIGCDNDNGGTARSDSMMLVSIDRANNKIKLTSFMRDMWVYIPDNDYAKLNAAFAYGGAGLLMDTIEYNFGIKIDNYAMVDFEIFSSIIDELGGVEVEVTEKEADFINRTTRQTVESGKTVLNGDEALVYCRIRYLDSDFMRTQRQRKVMESIVAKVKGSNPFTMYNLAEVILPQVKTDITKGEMILLGLGALAYMGYDVEQLRIPIDNTYTEKYFGDQLALSIDFDANKKALIDFIYS